MEDVQAWNPNTAGALQNSLEFLRMRSMKYEILVAPRALPYPWNSPHFHPSLMFTSRLFCSVQTALTAALCLCSALSDAVCIGVVCAYPVIVESSSVQHDPAPSSFTACCHSERGKLSTR